MIAFGVLDVGGGGAVDEEKKIASLADQFGGGLGFGLEKSLHDDLRLREVVVIIYVGRHFICLG